MTQYSFNTIRFPEKREYLSTGLAVAPYFVPSSTLADCFDGIRTAWNIFVTTGKKHG